jgi:hypothetical protein
MKGKSPPAGGAVENLRADRHYPTEIRSGAGRSMELPEFHFLASFGSGDAKNTPDAIQ